MYCSLMATGMGKSPLVGVNILPELEQKLDELEEDPNLS